MGEQYEKGKVRRTRGPASVKRKKPTTAINGERFPTLQAAMNALSASVRQPAASVDASGASAAAAATSPAAGTDHGACAEAAGSRNRKEAKPRVPSEHEKVSEPSDDLPAGQGELPADSKSFVAQVHARVDLCAAWERLVRAKDLKISQRALEKLSELDYEQARAENEEQQQFEIDVPPRERNQGGDWR
jgi:hypothetical protein